MLPPSWKSEVQKAVDETAHASGERQKTESQQSSAEIAGAIKSLVNSYDTQHNKPERKDKIKRLLDVATVVLLFATAFFTGLAWLAFRDQLTEMRRAYEPLKQSADVSLAVQQPYIFVPPPKYSVSVVPPITFPVPNMTYSMENQGLTPAIVRFRKWVLYISDLAPNKDIHVDDWVLMESFVIAKEKHWSKTEIIHAPGPNLSIKSTTTIKAMMFWILVQYFDIFDYVHTVRYLFYAPIRGNVGENGTVGEFTAISGKPYSYHEAVKAPPGQWRAEINAAPPYGQ